MDFMIEHNQWIVGTPDDCIAGIERLQEISGRIRQLHDSGGDWAPREKILHSYELLARYVMPHFQGSLVGIRPPTDGRRTGGKRCRRTGLPGCGGPPTPITPTGNNSRRTFGETP